MKNVMNTTEITYLILAIAVLIIAFKLNVNEVIKSVFLNKMSLNRIIILSLTIVILISMFMKETQTTAVGLGGLIAFLQASKKDGKNGGKQ